MTFLKLHYSLTNHSHCFCFRYIISRSYTTYTMKSWDARSFVILWYFSL
jgi:hypothetical protein